MKLRFSCPFWLFFAPFHYCFFLIARYYAINNSEKPSKNNSKSIYEKNQNSFLIAESYDY